MEAIREDLESKLHIIPVFEYMKGLEDKQLAESFIMGNKAAFNEIYRRYQRGLHTFIYRSIGNYEDVEDIVQLTFFRAYNHIREYNPRLRFSTWLFAIAKNLVKNKIRDDARYNKRFLSNQQLPEYLVYNEPITKGNGEYTNLLNAVEKAIKNLRQIYSDIAFLRFIQNLGYEKIAESERMNLGTVKSRIHRARVQLKQNKELKRVIYNYL